MKVTEELVLPYSRKNRKTEEYRGILELMNSSKAKRCHARCDQSSIGGARYVRTEAMHELKAP